MYAQLLADVETEVAALEARGDTDDSSSYGDSSTSTTTASNSGVSGTRGDSPQGRGTHDVRLATSLKIIETVSALHVVVCACTSKH